MPDRLFVSVGEIINWTLRGFHNPIGGEVADFAIIDIPGLGLNFQSGSIPAFANGAGITYEIRYRVAGSNVWFVHATGIDASQPFTFNLPQPGNLHYTEIGLFFGNVPAGFGLGNEIVLGFITGDNAPNNTLINRFLIRFYDIELEGDSPERPIVVTPGTTPPPGRGTTQQPVPTPLPGQLPQTGLDSRVMQLFAGLALSALVSIAAVVIIRKHKKENVV